MKRIFFMLIFSLTVSCSTHYNTIGTIKIKGSDTMRILNEMLAENFMKANPGISVYVDGGGTLSGVNSLINNEIDICAASRPLGAGEVKELADRFLSLGMSYLIARDALSVYVNNNNKIIDFSIGQLKKIFTGTISNWSELGGNEQKIIIIIRNKNSGTYQYFKDLVLEGEEYSDDAIVEPTTLAIIKSVIKDENAIGYGGIGYKQGIVLARVNGIEPSIANVINNKYPITRYLHFYTIGQPEGLIKKYIDWVISPEGQRIVKNAGYFPLWDISN